MSSASQNVDALPRTQHNVTAVQVERHFTLYAIQDLVVVMCMCFVEVNAVKLET